MNKMYLSRFVTPALFALLTIQSLDWARPSELNPSWESQPGSSYLARQLAETAARRKKNVSSVRSLKKRDNIKIADENGINATENDKHVEDEKAEVIERKIKLQFGVKESDVSQDLSKAEIDKMLNSFGQILSQRQQYIIFHQHTKYLNKIYNEMTDKMWGLAEKMAFKYRVPHEAMVRYWYKCENGLKNDLNLMNNFAYKNFYSYIQKKPSQPAIKFKLFLSLHDFSWNKEMNENEQKWVQKLAQKMQNYKNKGDKQHMK
ncbi:Plasmodium exported protein (PHIST), unknown function [Plasmodium vivax]|uniref:Plasmodium RESA N-terminal domain-containing protein n=1 Tax=Plasmodium vivax TaxID=5855 RepID=A0A564ZVE6_PLAVI|nr:Plasmodium exported protein (PHIST), unknown function [Plasmodium vivax]VUZ95216.1 Plasmodium exported protein (PHIST), unknown function [Plasmodium vivax]